MIIVDVETSGLDPQKNSILSIGAINFSHPENQFSQECYAYPGARLDTKSLKFLGLTKKQVTDRRKKTLEQIVREFLNWTKNIKDKTILGKNPSFDRDFLRASMERYKIKWKLGYRTIDLHSIGYAHYLKRGLNPPFKEKISDLSLDKILNYVGLPTEPKPHQALMGAKMEAEAFSRLVYGKPLLEEFKKYPAPDYLP